MQTLAIRHVAFEDLGSLAPLLARRGHRITYHEAADGFAGIDPCAPDLVVVLGGPIGVYQDADYPFLGREIALLRERITARRPVLGLCLGAQLLARAAGAAVYPGAAGKEIGWAPVALSADGRCSPLRHLEPATPVLHWHGDTFDLPDGAVHLASSGRYHNQAFALGVAVLALQFHPEITAAGLEHWLIGHAGEIDATEGVTVAALREGARHHAAALAIAAGALFAEWLDRNRL